MNKEIRYNDVKEKNGKVTICLRFYAENNVDDELGLGSDIYLPIFVKVMKISKADVKKYGGVAEFCRLNLTKWKVIGAPKESMKYVKKIIGNVLWCYFNGAECSWKFFNPDANKKTYGSYIIKGKIDDKTIDKLQKLCVNCYEPHNDGKGNYGDESVHAVYDLKCED